MKITLEFDQNWGFTITLEEKASGPKIPILLIKDVLEAARKDMDRAAQELSDLCVEEKKNYAPMVERQTLEI